MLEQLNQLLDKSLQDLETVTDLEVLDQWRVTYLGKKSELIQLLRHVGKLPREERPAAGKRGNEVKIAMEEAYATRETTLKVSNLEKSLKEEAIDVTLPGRQMRVGHLHLSTLSLREMYEIFAKMGYGKIVNPATAPGLMTITLRDGNRVLGLNPKQMKDLLKALNDAGVEV